MSDERVAHGRGTSIRWFHGFDRYRKDAGLYAPVHPVEVLTDGTWRAVTSDAAQLPDDWNEWTSGELAVFRAAASRPALTRDEERAAFLIAGDLPRRRHRTKETA